MDLFDIVDIVIENCDKEEKFIEFNRWVHAEQGWEWIIAQKKLKGKVEIPRQSAREIWPTDNEASHFVRTMLNDKHWDMLGYDYYDKKVSVNVNFGRLYFFKDLIRKLGRSTWTNRYFIVNPVSEPAFSSINETGISMSPLPHGGYIAFQLVGDVSKNWKGLQGAGQKFLAYIDEESDLPLSKRLGKLKKTDALEKFSSLVEDSGESCLLGVMIADVKNKYGQCLRVVSFTANMVGSTGQYTAHTKRSQGNGSQVHMEIFQFERIGWLLKAFKKVSEISEVSVTILAVKTSNVVGENDMCPACRKVKIEQIDNLFNGMKNIAVDVLFLGS